MAPAPVDFDSFDPASGPLISLEADDGKTAVRADVAVGAGGRLAQITIESDAGRTQLLADPPDGSFAPWSTGWGCFAMAPWVGRIRNGRFRFGDTDVALDVNHRDRRRDAPDGTAGGGTVHPPAAGGDSVEPTHHSIHGTTYQREWTIVRRDGALLVLECELRGRLAWPFPGAVRNEIELLPGGLRSTLSIEATEQSGFPAAIGWHPWFAKPDRLSFRPTAMYERDDWGLPTGELVDVAEGPWDDCFLNTEPVTLHYRRAVAATVTMSADCDHWVVYDHPRHATCVEAQSGPPDAPTLQPRPVTPGHPLTRTMTIGWETDAAR